MKCKSCCWWIHQPNAPEIEPGIPAWARCTVAPPSPQTLMLDKGQDVADLDGRAVFTIWPLTQHNDHCAAFFSRDAAMARMIDAQQDEDAARH